LRTGIESLSYGWVILQITVVFFLSFVLFICVFSVLRFLTNGSYSESAVVTGIVLSVLF